MMKTRRHHFSVSSVSAAYSLHAYVPDEGGQDAALETLKADDPWWRREGVIYHGMVDWDEKTHFFLTYPEDTKEAVA